jgi:hypothetical protein
VHREAVTDLQRPTQSTRIVVAVAMGLLCGAVSLASAIATPPPGYQDFAFLWFGAKAILAGKSPYEAVVSLSGNPIFYFPLTTPLAILPFVSLPLVIAGPLYVTLTCGALAYVVTAYAWWPLLMFASGSMVVAVLEANFATILPLGLFVPWLGWLGVLKPNIGLGILAYRPSWKNTLVMAALGAASLAVRPTWPQEWINAALHSPFHFAPWRTAGGFILCLAVLRWRQPEARLLVMMSLLPSSPIAYEALPLFIIPRSRVEMLILAVGTNLAFALVTPFSLQGEPAQYLARAQPAMVWLVYVPTLIMVLRRPNVGNVPHWLDRLALRAPAWIRGEPA